MARELGIDKTDRRKTEIRRYCGRNGADVIEAQVQHPSNQLNQCTKITASGNNETTGDDVSHRDIGFSDFVHRPDFS
jgi:hypothetical protein